MGCIVSSEGKREPACPSASSGTWSPRLSQRQPRISTKHEATSVIEVDMTCYSGCVEGRIPTPGPTLLPTQVSRELDPAPVHSDSDSETSRDQDQISFVMLPLPPLPTSRPTPRLTRLALLPPPPQPPEPTASRLPSLEFPPLHPSEAEALQPTWLLATEAPPLPPQPPLRCLPQDVWSRVAGQLDPASRGVLRQCSHEARALVDMTALRLRVVASSALPEERAPSCLGEVERALRGMMARGCRPRCLRLNLSHSSMPEQARQRRGRAVLLALSEAASLEELSLCGLPLSAQPLVPDTLAAGLTRLSLSGESATLESLQGALQALMQAMPRLRELELSNQRVTSLALSGPGGWATQGSQMQPSAGAAGAASGGGGTCSKRVWQPLWEAASLRSLTLNFCDGGEAGDGGGGAGEPGGSGGGGRFGVAAQLATAFARGLAGMTQLTSLSLGLWRDRGLLLSPALPLICGSLSNLRAFELRCDVAPPNLLACLASLPQLGTLALLCEQATVPEGSAPAAMLDVHLLCQLTAVTRMTLVNALPPAAVQRAVDAVPGGTWGLPPRLAVLELRQRMAVEHLARMAPPPNTLRTVSLSGAVLLLSGVDAATSPEAARQQMASVASKLAARGVHELSLQAQYDRYHLHPYPHPRHHIHYRRRHNVDSHQHARHHPLSCWMSELAPLELRVLRLYDVALDEPAVHALCAAVGSSLEELSVDGNEAPLVVLLPGLTRMARLRQLSFSGVFGVGQPPGTSSGGGEVGLWDAGVAAAGRGGSGVWPPLSPLLLESRCDEGTSGEGAAEDAGGTDGGEGDGGEADWQVALRILLSRGVDVRLRHLVPYPCPGQEAVAARLQEAVAATVEVRTGWVELDAWGSDALGRDKI